jgi:hypothetical protein
MSLLKTSVLAAGLIASLARGQEVPEHDSVTLLQGQIQEKTVSKQPGYAEEEPEPASTYNLADTAACADKEAASSKFGASVEPTAPPASFTEHIKPLRLTPEAETGDPAGASSLRAFLEIAIIAIIFDGMRRWHLRKKEASKHTKEIAESRRSARADAESNWTEMVNAASKADEAAFQKALAKKPSVAVTDTWGCTALHFAAAGGSPAIAKELLKRGAEVDALDASEETPLHFAARAGHAPICEILLDAGAQIDAVNVQDFTSLVIAGKANQESTCRLLADRGAGAAGMADDQLPPLVVSQLVRKVFQQ